MATPIRVRFAPSPTGPLHIGGVRTALFNYLFAKKHGGTFILRIEDTDQNRFVEGAQEYIAEALNWLQIPYDEGPGKDGGFGPYKQSERKGLYAKFAQELINSGNAYYAFDTPESLTHLRSQAEAKKETFIYNWHNRESLDNSLSLSDDQTKQRITAGDSYVIRFKSPAAETLVLHDIIRGDISINTATLDDKILFKSDGMPTYHLANIVDDHLMEISHVIRGEEWLPSMPLHVLLYRAFGWDAPKFAHLPLIMKPQGKGKLSKRDGDKMGFPVFPLLWKAPDGSESSGYREDGYLPQAVINMLAFLGWNPGTEQELFSLKQLVAAFDLDRVQKGGAKFDPEKTKWFQHQYLQQQTNTSLAQTLATILDRHNITTAIPLETVVGLLKERATFAKDLFDLSSYFFITPNAYDPKAAKKAFKAETPQLLSQVVQHIEQASQHTAAELSSAIKGWITTNEIGFGKVMMPLRLALVGSLQGPDVFDILELLGKQESIARITNAIAFMQA